MKIVTFSFDDGETYDEKLCEMFRRYGLRASFGLRSNYFGKHGDLYREDGQFYRSYETIRKEDVSRIYRGFEICSHGANHRSFDKLTWEELEEEIGSDQKILKELTGQEIIGAIYPGGNFNDLCIKNLKKLGIRFCRTCDDGTYPTGIPKEWLAWVPTCHFKDSNLPDLINSFTNDTEEEVKILHVFGHSYELEFKDRDWWGYMEDICRAVRGIPGAKFLTLGETFLLLNRSQTLAGERINNEYSGNNNGQ